MRRGGGWGVRSKVRSNLKMQHNALVKKKLKKPTRFLDGIQTLHRERDGGRSNHVVKDVVQAFKYQYKHSEATHQPTNQTLHPPSVSCFNSHDFLPGWTQQYVTEDMR